MRGAARRSPSTVSVTTIRPSRMIATRSTSALHLVQLVRGQEHRAAVGDGLADQPLELVLQQRIQPGGRLVEHQQFGPVHEREHQPDLLPVALRQCPYRAVQLDAEPFDELVAIARGRHAAHARPNRSRCWRPVSRGYRASSPGRYPTWRWIATASRAGSRPRHGHAPDRRGTGRAAAGSWSTFPLRSARGSRTPLPGSDLETDVRHAAPRPERRVRPSTATTAVGSAAIGTTAPPR